MPRKRKRCTDAALFCDTCIFLDSIGGLGSDSASRKIRCQVKQSGKNVQCMGHRDVVSRHDNCVWNHTVWTCDCAYDGKSWDGLKEDCHVLKHGDHMTQVCQDYKYKNYCPGNNLPWSLISITGAHSKWRAIYRSKPHGGRKSKTYRSDKRRRTK